jgi:hypothetical protein
MVFWNVKDIEELMSPGDGGRLHRNVDNFVTRVHDITSQRTPNV